MSNSKISALTSATTPLAGTEVLPVNQSGTTTEVSVANLTAGRSVSAASLALTTSPLPATSGGTGSSSAFTANGVGYASTTTTFVTGSGLSFDGTNLFVGNNSLSFGGGYTNITASGSSGGSLWVANNANTGQAFFAVNSGTAYVGTQTNQPLTVWVNNIQRFSFDTSGNLTQSVSGKGINFTANTPQSGMTSQLLNWYEEGTWTPNQGSGLTVTGTFSSSGSYVKVGKAVTVNFRLIATTSIIASNLGVLLSNLPFSVKADTIGAFGVGVNGAGTTTFNHQASGTSIYLEGSNIAATNNIYGSINYITT
jgi:hypothetical protein